MEDEWREDSKLHGLIGLGLFLELGLFLQISFLFREGTVVFSVVWTGGTVKCKRNEL